MTSPTDSSKSDSGISRCPVDPERRSFWPFGGNGKKECSSEDDALPASLEEAAKYAQTPQPGQRVPLSTHRAVSSIPRGAAQNQNRPPHHQPSDETAPGNWVYPSEQQVFNAMKRKGWQGIEETSIPAFLQIHNSVNERSWNALKEWEDPNVDLQLVKFEGRPNDMTPKAWFLSTLGLADKPFDRHDWYIDNGVDKQKRYVLDFYMSENKMTGMPRVDIDVRPALDSPQAFAERGIRSIQELFPGITQAYREWKAQQSN